MQEMWKNVVGFEEFFEVSNLGVIRSKERMVNNKGKMVLKPSKVLSPFNNGKGYQQITLWADGKSYKRYVHRMVAEAFIDNPNSLSDVNHEDGNKGNNKVDNLTWCTRKDNINHAIDSGLIMRDNNRFSKV